MNKILSQSHIPQYLNQPAPSENPSLTGGPAAGGPPTSAIQKNEMSAEQYAEMVGKWQAMDEKVEGIKGDVSSIKEEMCELKSMMK